MEKTMFFLWSLVIISATSCVDYTGFDDQSPVINSGDYYLKVNGSPVKSNDTVYVTLNQINLLEMFSPGGEKVSGVFYSINLTSAFAVGTIADITYTSVGTYRVTAKLPDGSKSVSVYLSVVKSTNYNLKVNDVVTSNGSTINTTTTQSLKFKVVDSDGKAVKTSYDFGNGDKVTADSTTTSYASAGTYTMKAVVAEKTIIVTIKVTKGAAEAVILLNSVVFNSMINATFGFRCDAIPSYSTTKATYVVGDYPGISWKKFDLTEVVEVAGVKYFKWNIGVPAGAFRLSWIQQKDPSAAFNYDLCNWAYDTSSAYWDASDFLFHFYLRIVDGKAVLSKN